jgi:hypothetical protein
VLHGQGFVCEITPTSSRIVPFADGMKGNS